MKTSNPWLYHGLPLFVIVFPFIWVALAGDDRWLKGEAGIVENATVVFLVIAIGFCVSSLKLASRQGLSTGRAARALAMSRTSTMEASSMTRPSHCRGLVASRAKRKPPGWNSSSRCRVLAG